MADLVIRSFAAGELSPALAVRADLAKYTQGLRTARNFLVQRNGGAANRPGFRFVSAAKTDAANVKLARYVSPREGESVLIEVGENYLRFFLNGAPVSVAIADVDDWDMATDYVIGDLVRDGGVIYYALADNTNSDPPSVNWSAFAADGTYEIPTPFDSVGLLNWSQSGQTITLTWRDNPPHELIFEAIDRWIFRAVQTLPRVDAPANPLLTGTAGTLSYGYVVTAAAPFTYEESLPSAQVIDASAAAPTDTAPHVISWDAVTVEGEPAPEYYVYCDPYGNGQYGFIGTAVGATTFKDPGIAPDFALTPPLARTPFAAAGDYPHVSATHQQRRIFAQTTNVPDLVEGSRVGYPSNFGIASPLQDDDALSFKIAGNNNHSVRHLLSLKHGLIALTGGGEWTVEGPQGAPLSPNALDPQQETYLGVAEDVRPAVVGNGVIYLQARASKVYELKFDVQVEGLGGRDLTVFAAHLFDGFTFTSMDLQLTPNSIVWAVRSDGVLLGLTYVPEQDVWGWHRHDTQDGVFLDVCVVPEAGEDVLYVLVAREVGGDSKVYLERLASRVIFNWNRDVFFVDAGLTYNGAPVATVSGLDHLEGKVVAVVGDGDVIYNGDPAGARASLFTVTGGTIVLPAAKSIIHVGLAIQYGDLETLDLDIAGSDVRGKSKTVHSVTMLLENSARAGIYAGPDTASLIKFKQAPYDSTVKSFTGSIEIPLLGKFNTAGRVAIRQTDPLPLTVLGLIPNVEVNG